MTWQGSLREHPNLVVRNALVVLEKIVIDQGIHHGNQRSYADAQATVLALDPSFPMDEWMAFARDVRAARVERGWG